MDEQGFIDELYRNRQQLHYFPDPQKATRFIDALYRFLFVCHAVQQPQKTDLAHQLHRLENDLLDVLTGAMMESKEAGLHTRRFFDALPQIYQYLLSDAAAITAFDPAAQNRTEVMATYPGFYATVVYRLAHQLWQQQIQLLPRLLTEYAHSKTGIDIHPGASIGQAFAIDHGTGIVIGETAIIRSNVKIYQGVTLGALSVSKDKASTKRHPTIDEDVVIYSGATILGGETVIGKGSIIGGNVWITHSIPPNSVVYHTSEIKVKDKNPFPEPLNFVI